MSDAQAIATIIVAISAMGVWGVIVKGQVFVFTRELDREKAACKEICTEKERSFEEVQGRVEDENLRLRESLEAIQAELKEQTNANATLYREVLSTISWLQSLAGLAASERRDSRRG